ncbi:hypothetical protein D3C81_2018420 [compost metagenome]
MYEEAPKTWSVPVFFPVFFVFFMRLRFEAVSHMPEAEKSVIKALLDGMILKYQASRIMGTSSNNQASS